MKCPNCGAEYDKNTNLCPFCGSENLKGAKKQHNDEINKIHKRTSLLKKQSDRVVKKSTKILFLGVAAAVIIFVISLVAILIGGRMKGSNAKKQLENNMVKLEEVYNTGDYEKLWDTLQKIDDYYSATYGKYYNTGRLYRDYTMADGWLYVVAYNSYAEIGSYTVNDIREALADGFNVIKMADEYRTDGYRYGEKKAVEDITELMKQSICNYGCLSDEEYQDAYLVYRNEYVNEENDGNGENNGKEQEEVRESTHQYTSFTEVAKEVRERMKAHEVEARNDD